MSRPVSALRNLGPSTDAAFARVGIHSAEELIGLGADAAYLRLLRGGARPHFSGYWTLVLAIEDRHWRESGPEEKAALRARFEALKADARLGGGDRSALEAELDRLGVRDLPTGSRPERT
jgi:DNA transformation protein and related proteins